MATDLPTNFPCWCRAIYSFSPETKNDLGFVEGELIEALNAGDGSWWTGRRRRDKTVGSFPSNFVQVLPETFAPPPASRCSSPLPPARQPSPAPPTQKSFRKPFQSMQKEKPAKDNAVATSGSHKMRRPFSSMAKPKDSRSPFGSQNSNNGRPVSQMASPAARSYLAQRQPSPLTQRPHSRAPSPNPVQHRNSRRQTYSYGSEESPHPPPAPPPHRYATSRAPSPQPMHMQDIRAKNRTPEPHFDEYHQEAKQPSPFTAAYADIMDTFKDMSLKPQEDVPQEQEDPEREERTKSIWGPDDFDKMYGGPTQERPKTATLGATQPDSGYGTSFDTDSDRVESNAGQLDEYVPRMEKRLRQLQDSGWTPRQDQDEDPELRPPLPAKNSDYDLRDKSRRPLSSFGSRKGSRLKKQKSAYELGRDALTRTFTTKTNSTNTTNSTNMTERSIMSGTSIGQYSVKSAGSFYRRKLGMNKSEGGVMRPMSSVSYLQGGPGFTSRPETPATPQTGVSFQSGNATTSDSLGGCLLGGLTTPSPKKSGFFKKMIDSARASAATARVTLASSSGPGSPQKMQQGISNISGVPSIQSRPQSSARDMGLGSVDWVQVRRDLYRSNSLSLNERQDRSDRCQMLDISVMLPVEELLASTEGGESLDGLPVSEPVDFASCNLSMVDKSARFVNNLPPSTTPAALVQGYLCRPYRSDVQRLRAIFTWVSERISWEEDYQGDIDLRRVMQTKRGCTEEIAYLVAEMCGAVGVQSEVIHGHLKIPGEPLDIDLLSRPNHWWNAVIVDGEWRVMDCSLAGPTNPRRALFSTVRSQGADTFWFLTSPLQACFTHVPMAPEHQHLMPAVSTEVLFSLPCACPPYFQHNLEIFEFDTSLIHLDNLELAHVHFFVPEDIELVAEVETRAFAHDSDGDLFENGDVVKKPALAQAEWIGGKKRFTIKALLPGDEGQGVLKIYAGKRGLMHSIKSNPHPLALALPLSHTGSNPPYNFLTRHPTPHAQRHDLYVAQPQCARLAANNTFVFSVRQHPSSLTRSPAISSSTTFSGRASPNPLIRPTSAMSMASVSITGSNYSNGSNGSNSTNSSGGVSVSGGIKPAKLAIQTPSGKIIRLTRKAEHTRSIEVMDGSEWETVIKVGEQGIWRGLVLADRSARWCVFAEWECI